MKQRVQDRRSGSAIFGDGIGFFDLTENLAFANDQGIDAARHPKQVPDTIIAAIIKKVFRRYILRSRPCQPLQKFEHD